MVAIAHRPDPPSDTPSRLARIAELATDLGSASLAAEARSLTERIADRRFYVACVGQFKRGKSSLLNALLGEPLLPTGVVPVTSVITTIRFGERRSATVHTVDGQSVDIAPADIALYVTEAQNPGNEKRVAGVEVALPHDLLKLGMCLVDTPGLASVFSDATAVTKAFVPHIDAALVVLGTDPPVSHDEIELIETLAKQTEELIFVLNKADRVPASERVEARRFSDAVIAQHLGRPVSPLLEVSATEGLAGSGPSRDWDALTRRLSTLAERSGAALVEAAAARGAQLLGNRLLHSITEREGALLRPVAETRSRVQALKRSADEAERSLRELGYIFSAEQDRLHRIFEKRQEEFLARTRSSAREELLNALRVPSRSRRELWQDANRLPQDIFRRILDEWRRVEQPIAEKLYRESAGRFTDLANDFLRRMRAEVSGLAAFDLPPLLAPEGGFRTKSRLYFTELLHTTTRSPLRFLVDSLRTQRSYRAAVERHATTYLERLMLTNATRVTNDLDELVAESRRRLEHDVQTRLRDGDGVARDALARAELEHSRGEAAVASELRRLRGARTYLESLLGSEPT